MAPNYLTDTLDLIESQNAIPTAPTFFLDRFFRRTFNSTRETIAFEEVLEQNGLPTMAPFVSPIVQAKPQKRSGATVKMFSPAYLKPKHFIKPGDFISRTPGEPFLVGDLTPNERYDREVIRLLALQKEQIIARWEWMAAQAIVNGAVTVSGEDYPAVQVDFGRDAGNTIQVVGAGNVWSNTAAPITNQLEDWSLLVLDASGYAGTDIIFSPEAWRLFRANASIRDDAALLRGIQAVPMVQARVAQAEGVQAMGQWGQFNLWVYSGRFREQDGTMSRVLAANQLLVCAAPAEETGGGGVNGVRAFGAIQDRAAGLAPLDMFPKRWEEQDPSGEQLMTQSAPLMIPGRPNAVAKVTVV